MSEKFSKDDDDFVLTVQNFENLYNQGNALQQLAKPTEALRKYKKLCEAVEYQYNHGHMSKEDLHYVPIALSKMADIYHARPDLHKALLYMTTARQFIEFLHPEKKQEDSEEMDPNPPKDIPSLFKKMHSRFDSMDSLLLPDSNEIIRKFLDSKRIHDEEVAQGRIHEIENAVKRKYEYDQLTFSQRFELFYSNHPYFVLFGAIGVILFFTFFFIVMTVIRSLQVSVSKLSEQSKKVHHDLENNLDTYQSKEGYEEDEKQFREMLENYKLLPNGNTKELLEKLRKNVDHFKKKSDDQKSNKEL